MLDHDAMRERMAGGQGFIAALDQSGGSTPKALTGYGVAEGSWADEEEMFGLIHRMRERIVTAPSFGDGRIIGAILFERTMDGEADGRPVPELLKERGVVPFLKVDKGLEEERDGVQRMKPIPDLDELCRRARDKGVFGTKMRSVINRADERGIADVVDQQFEVAARILDHGLMPIIEPEVTIKSPDRAECDRLLLRELTRALDALPDDRQVMLKLSIPAEPNLYRPLIDHPRVLRVVALSGGFSREEACRELARNEGMIASFSRALLQDLRHQMGDEEFDEALGRAAGDIHAASTEKVAA